MGGGLVVDGVPRGRLVAYIGQTRSNHPENSRGAQSEVWVRSAL